MKGFDFHTVERRRAIERMQYPPRRVKTFHIFLFAVALALCAAVFS